MNQILTSYGSSGQPFPYTHLEFWKQANEQLFDSIIRNMLPQNPGTKNYVLYGCVVTTGGGNTVITQGAIWSGGLSRIVFVPGQSAAGLGNVIADLIVTYDDSAGTNFEDSTNHQILRRETVRFSIGASGTGTLNGGASAANDLSEFTYLYPIAISDAGTFDGQTFTFERSRSIIYGGTATGSCAITLDFTDAIIGNEVTFLCDLSSVSAVDLGLISSWPIFLTGPIASYSGKTRLYVKLRYLGATGGNYITEVTINAI